MTKKQNDKNIFDILLSLPLLLYLLMILVLVLGIFLTITKEAFREALKDPSIFYAMKLSFFSTVISTLLAVLFAIPSGYILSKYKFKGIFFIDTILDLPIILPPLVMGLTVLIFFNTPLARFIESSILEFIYTWRAIILVQFIVGCAFAIRVIKAGFDMIDRKYEEVAMTLGANRSQAFFKIVLPLVRKSIISGTVISWARIFGLFGPVLLVAGTMRNKTEIMPTTIFLEISIGRIEVALVIAALMIIMSITTLVIFKKMGGQGYIL